MKNAFLALSMIAVLAVSACANGTGTWTPEGAGRTAGEGTFGSAEWQPARTQADTSFNSSLRK